MRIRRPLPRLGALLGGALALLTCDSPVQPRGSDVRIAVDSLVASDVAAGTTRRYSFVAIPGREYAVLVEAPKGAVQLTVIDSMTSQFVATVDADPTTGPLATTATPNFRSTTGTVYVLIFTGLPYVGVQFTFVAFAVDAAPERHAVAIAIGDTVVGEAIDPLVDVDTFVAPGQAGEDVVAVIEATGTAGSGVVSLTVWDSPTGQLLGSDLVNAGDTSPPTSGRFQLPTTGAYRFEVRSVSSKVFPRYQGPYRFWSYAVNRKPESLADSVALGDSVLGEAIDVPGDVDEFRVSVPDSSDANLVAQIGASATGGGLDVTLVDSGGHEVAAARPLTAGAVDQSGTVVLGPGTYTLRVQGYADTGDERSQFVGPYVIWLFKLPAAP